MPDSYPPSFALVRLAVEHVAAHPEDEQRYLELIFAVDRAVEQNLRYRELLGLLEEGAASAQASTAWAWRLAAGLSANLMGDAPAAIRLLERARADLDTSSRSATPVASFLYGELARAHYHHGNHSEGLEVVTRALQLARAANSPLAQAYAHHYLGLISIRRRDFDFARRHLTSSVELFEQMNQRLGRARVLDSLASLDMELGDHHAARGLLQESLLVKEELHDLRGQALTCFNLARLHTALAEYPEALHYLAREGELTTRVGDERNATLAQVQLGELHLRHGKPALAHDELRTARFLACQRGDVRLEARACFILAQAEWELGRREAALESIRQACSYYDGADDPVMRDRAALRLALLQGEGPDSPRVRDPLDRLRQAGLGAALAEALFETATHCREAGLARESATLGAEALDAAEPVQAIQLAEAMRRRADGVEGRAWVDAMLIVKEQKDRLEQAYAKLRKEENLRESLTQMIVHDLKNPLTGITPWLQMIQSGTLSEEETATSLQTAIDECEYLLRIIEDLNDVGKMQHEGTLDLTLSDVDLGELTRDVARRLQNRARESGMTIRVPGPTDQDPAGPDALSDLPPVRCDRSKLRRVLENLVGNAIKYGRPPEGSPHPAEVRVGGRREPGPEPGLPDWVRIEVSDFGEGIPLAEAERVFEPYYQAEAGRKRKAGVGLGLTFSRMVVEAHRGSIWTEPNSEGGSNFIVRLPIGTLLA